MGDKSDGFNLDDLARQLAQSLPKNLRALGGDIERNFRALLQSGLEKMDLVTREEFDVQSAVLERTREKLEKIDARLVDLERGLAARNRGAEAAAGTTPAADAPSAPATATTGAPTSATAAPTPTTTPASTASEGSGTASATERSSDPSA